jgi:hypothetical protein
MAQPRSLLESVRAMRDQSQPSRLVAGATAAPESFYMGVALGESYRAAPRPEHHLSLVPMMSSSGENPTAEPLRLVPDLPPLAPTPIDLASQPSPDEILQTSSGPHPSHPPLLTVYDWPPAVKHGPDDPAPTPGQGD